MAIQPFVVEVDYVSDTLCEAIIPNHGDLIANMYVKGVSNIASFQIVINDEIIQSFTGEYIKMKQFLETPKQKSNCLTDSEYTVIPCKKYLPVFPFIKLRIEMKTPQKPSILLDYIFLEKPPVYKDMLIEQVTEIFTDQRRIEMNLKHPVKEMYIIVRDQSQTDMSNLLTVTGDTQLKSIKFEMNENIKFDLPAIYFSKVQPMDYHSRVPVSPYIFYTYSFALDPESPFPTGTINMGRIKHQVLTLTTTDNAPKYIKVYVTGYNVIASDGKLYFT